MILGTKNHLTAQETSPTQLGPGVIITTDSDTLNCMLPISFFYGEEIPIQLKGEHHTLTKEEIIYLSHAEAVFETVEYEYRKKHCKKLLKVVSKGTIDLYVDIPSTMALGSNVEFLAKKGGVAHFLTHGNYKKSMATLVADSPQAVEYFIQSKYQLSKIIDVVEFYNLHNINY
ncbi:MAG: hypothetical protein JXQ96_13125 [Cyclobacteriaceae bacterium]